VILLAY